MGGWGVGIGAPLPPLHLAWCVCLSSGPLEALPQGASTCSSFCPCPLASASHGCVTGGWLGSKLREVAEHLPSPPSSRSPYLGANISFSSKHAIRRTIHTSCLRDYFQRQIPAEPSSPLANTL